MRSLVASSLALCALLSGSVAAQPSADGSEASEPTPITFGRVPIEQPLSQTVGFDNPLAQELRVAAIRLTPPLVATDWTRAIPPGGRGSFTFALGEPRRPGPYEGAIVVEFAHNAMPPLVFELSGTLVPAVELVPRSALFVVTERGVPKDASLEIVNHRERALVLGALPPDTERYSLRLETLEAGRRFRLTARMSGAGAPGRAADKVAIPIREPETGALELQLFTLLHERVYSFPDEVYFGVLPSAQLRDPAAAPLMAQTLMIFRKGRPGFEVEATSTLDFVHVRAERGPDGDRWQLTLELDPARTPAGEFVGRLIVTTNDAEFARLEVPLRGAVLAAGEVGGAPADPP